MRIKHAYNTLMNSNSRRGNQTSGFSRSSTERNQRGEAQEEEFYGLGKSSYNHPQHPMSYHLASLINYTQHVYSFWTI